MVPANTIAMYREGDYLITLHDNVTGWSLLSVMVNMPSQQLIDLFEGLVLETLAQPSLLSSGQIEEARGGTLIMLFSKAELPPDFPQRAVMLTDPFFADAPLEHWRSAHQGDSNGE